MTPAEIAEVKSIWVSEYNIESLKGIEFFTALEALYCYNDKLKTLDISKNTAPTVLGCWNNKLTSLDVSKNTELLSLWVSTNPIKTLDVSK